MSQMEVCPAPDLDTVVVVSSPGAVTRVYAGTQSQSSMRGKPRWQGNESTVESDSK